MNTVDEDRYFWTQHNDVGISLINWSRREKANNRINQQPTYGFAINFALIRFDLPFEPFSLYIWNKENYSNACKVL